MCRGQVVKQEPAAGGVVHIRGGDEDGICIAAPQVSQGEQDLSSCGQTPPACPDLPPPGVQPSAQVLVGYGPDALRLRIDDDGPAASGAMTGGGNGLVGMRERAAGLGGSVEAGPRDDGGFRVIADLPLHGAAPVSTGG